MKGEGIGKEAYERVNFLYQAAYLTIRNNPENVGLANRYLYVMKMVLQKKVLSMHHSIKRFLCKRCWSVLLPGLTATIRTKRRREKHIVLTCLQCKAVRRFMTKQGYELWCDSAQSKLPSTSVEDQHPLEARSNSNPLRQAGGENKKDHSKVDASQVNTLDVDVKLTLNDICSKVDERLGDDVHVITSRFDEQDKTAIRK